MRCTAGLHRLASPRHSIEEDALREPWRSSLASPHSSRSLLLLYQSYLHYSTDSQTVCACGEVHPSCRSLPPMDPPPSSSPAPPPPPPGAGAPRGDLAPPVPTVEISYAPPADQHTPPASPTRAAPEVQLTPPRAITTQGATPAANAPPSPSQSLKSEVNYLTSLSLRDNHDVSPPLPYRPPLLASPPGLGAIGMTAAKGRSRHLGGRVPVRAIRRETLTSCFMCTAGRNAQGSRSRRTQRPLEETFVRLDRPRLDHHRHLRRRQPQQARQRWCHHQTLEIRHLGFFFSARSRGGIRGDPPGPRKGSRRVRPAALARPGQLGQPPRRLEPRHRRYRGDRSGWQATETVWHLPPPRQEARPSRRDRRPSRGPDGSL